MKKFFALVSQKNFYLPLTLLILAVFLNFLGSRVIHDYFPGRTAPEDLLFRLTPYVSWTQYITDIANILSFILIVYYIFWRDIKQTGYAFSVFALAYGIRGLLIMLTPLGGSLGNEMHYGLTSIQQYGCFPSGHTIMVVLAYMFIQGQENRNLKAVALLNVLIEITSLILSRGHYSIDIAGALLVCYFSYHYLEPVRQPLALKTKSL